MRAAFIAVVLCLVVSVAPGQEPTSQKTEKSKDSQVVCPMHEARSRGDESSTAMNGRGQPGMGFSQTATTHHFLIRPTGGVIQVETNDAADVASRNNIRMHLTHIATAFANGDFAIPMFVHDTVPPGVPVMKQRSDKITYTFEETATGGRVVITTTDPHALAAVQQFLRFQIAEHKTGDPTAIPSAPSTAR